MVFFNTCSLFFFLQIAGQKLKTYVLKKTFHHICIKFLHINFVTKHRTLIKSLHFCWNQMCSNFTVKKKKKKITFLTYSAVLLIIQNCKAITYIHFFGNKRKHFKRNVCLTTLQIKLVSWTTVFCAFGRYLLKGLRRQLCKNSQTPDSADFNKNVVALQFELEQVS